MGTPTRSDTSRFPFLPGGSPRRDLLVVVCLGFFAAIASSAATDASDRKDLGSLHGPLEYLQQSLVQSAEDARLIAAAERQFQVGDNSLAFHALRTVFAHKHDAFTPLSPGRTSAGAYQLAIQLLQNASYRTRTEWAAAAEPLAAVALRQAGRDSREIENVARHYPYTESGLRAHMVCAVLAKSRGQQHRAKAILAELELIYAETAVRFNAGKMLASLRVHLCPEGDDQATSRSRIAGEQPLEAPAQLTLPWPTPLWKWQESVWEFPQGVFSFAGLTQPEQRSSLTLNSWQPTLTADAVILKTPFRVISFDRLSGSVQWSLRTDTTGNSAGIEDAGNHLSLTSPTSAEELLQMDVLGRVAVSDQFLFFVDHFRKLTDHKQYQRHGNIRFGRPPANLLDSLDPEEAVGGTRLVAIQLHPVPKIAWTVGDADDFAYQIQNRPDGESLPVAIGHDNQGHVKPTESESAFRSQYFPGVPLVHDQMLFVMSADEETIWLNCLTEATGRLLWRVPVTYQYESQPAGRGRFLVLSEPIPGASLCGVDGETVVCALKTGVVIGVRLTDGRFVWATNIRSEESSDALQRQSAFTMRAARTGRISFQPLLHQSRMIWAAQQSSHVHCLDTGTGRILWKVPRSADADGQQEGSEDQYAAAITDTHVILVGDRHIRSLSMVDGSQRWVEYLPPQTGRATCNDHVCLVPLQNGILASVDVQTGTTNLVSQDVFAGLAGGTIGTLAADADLILAATPLSVTAFPSTQNVVDRLRKEAADTPNSSGNSSENRLLQAHAAILSSDVSRGVTLLSELAEQSTAEPAVVAAQKLLADVLLRSLAETRFGNRNSAALDPDQSAAQLLRLPLTTEQRLRFAILTGGPLQADELPQDSEQRLPMLDLLPDWKSRADVVAWSILSADTAEKVASFRDEHRSRLSGIEHAIVFPQHVGTPAEQLHFARGLIDDNFQAAAELFLLAAMPGVTGTDRESFEHQIATIRKRPRSALAQTSPAKVPTGNIEFDETLFLRTDNRIAELLNASFVAVDTADWSTERLFVGSRDLFRVNMDTGAVSTPLRLPTTPEDAVMVNSLDSPGLLPLIGQDHVGTLSLTAHDGPSLLWWKRWQRDPADFSPLQLGPFGPKFLVVASENQLSCLHPFTGRLLWQRSITSGFQRSIRFAGDDQVIAVFGEHLRSCDVFRTSDGLQLDTVSLDIPENTVPLVSGRRVLFQQQQLLKLIDLQNGKDLLKDRGSLKIIRGGAARVISNHRAVMISDDVEVFVLNMQTGEVDLRCPIELQHGDHKLTGLSAFERDGRLFVLVKNWGDPYSQRSASSRMGDVRLDSGNLFCIDLKTGELLWKQATLPAVMPKVHGDKTDLMVKWAWQNPERMWQQQLGRRQNRTVADAERSLVLTIMDGRTGETLAERQHLSDAEPIRCVNDAATGIITLHTETSRIDVHYAR